MHLQHLPFYPHVLLEHKIEKKNICNVGRKGFLRGGIWLFLFRPSKNSRINREIRDKGVCS